MRATARVSATGATTGAPVRMLSTHPRISVWKLLMFSSSGSSENLFASVRANGGVKWLCVHSLQPAGYPARSFST